jgi:chromosome segregation ATPase
MKKLLVFLLVLAVAVGGVGYWRGWYTFGKGHPSVNREKFKQDRDTFKQAAGKKLHSLKDLLTRKKSEAKNLTGEAKAKKEKESADLEEQYKQLSAKINSLDEVTEDKLDSVEKDLNKDLDDLASRAGKGQDKPE